LDSVPGRGPGSGVSGTPDSLAAFLICVMANANLVENVSFARAVMKGRPAGKMCPLTGATTFGDALTRIFADKALAERVRDVQFDNLSAHILFHFDPLPVVFDDGQPPGSSSFLGTVRKKGLRRHTSITGDEIRALAKLPRHEGQVRGTRDGGSPNDRRNGCGLL
jgi:hypothetical protein